MPTSIEDLTGRITDLRQRQQQLRDHLGRDLTDVANTIHELSRIAHQARQVAAQLRHLGAHDHAHNAETGWVVVDPDQLTEDEFDRWCEEQRAIEACHRLGYHCGICDNCRRDGSAAYP
jgi:septal ring factor EnvC (AmiA/AmiB activator)